VRKIDNLNRIFLVLVISLITIFLFLVLRNIGLYPTVFADEYIYSKLSRLQPLSESTIPNYLYLKLYSFTNHCGDGFLGCAKIINCFFFISAAPFIYLITRRVANEAISVFVSLMAIIGPIGSYTAYYMPESLYFFSFWVFCWYFLKLCAKSEKWQWFFAGTFYAFSALIKPHALLFLPAILIYICVILFMGRCLISKHVIHVFLSFLIGVLVIKFGLSYMLAGPAGLTIFGPLYGSIAVSTGSGLGKYAQILQFASESFKGHLLVIVLLYGVPLALTVLVTAGMLFSRTNRIDINASQVSQYEKIAFFSLIVVLNLICVVALFTASIVNSDPSQTLYRLHMRYYNFALPLFYVVAAGALNFKTDERKPLRYTLGALFAFLCIYAVWTNLSPFTPNIIDSPEIRGLHWNYLYFLIVSALFLTALMLLTFQWHRGIKFYLFIALPMFVIGATRSIDREQNQRFKQDLYDKAGIFTKNYLSHDDISKLVVVGSELGANFRTLYYLDNATASMQYIQDGADYDLSKLPADKEWLLILGDHKTTSTPFYQIQMNGFTLIRASTDNNLDFKKDAWPGLIKNVHGLAPAEMWGTWSLSDVVLFEFLSPLPNEFDLSLNARAFGPNVDRAIKVSVGESARYFSLSENTAQKIIRLKNPTCSHVLQFEIPSPTSPKALGISEDERNLGVGFIQMKIVPVHESVDANAPTPSCENIKH